MDQGMVMGPGSVALGVSAVDINSHCVGLRWEEADRVHLAKLIALIAMGQAAKAALVIQALEPAHPDFAINALCEEAIISLSVQEDASGARSGYPRFQRDGFMFEAVSWIAAKQDAGADVILKPPHTSSTTQGLDGLMLEINRQANCILQATIFEDKCTDDPRATFLSKVLPALKARHSNKRSAELVSTASMLLSMAGFPERAASAESAKILDLSIRRYRSAFAVPPEFDSEVRRSFLFGRYEEINGVTAEQRVGACLVIQGVVREWFDEIAALAISYIDSLKE
jgi:hypothetical protein